MNNSITTTNNDKFKVEGALYFNHSKEHKLLHDLAIHMLDLENVKYSYPSQCSSIIEIYDEITEKFYNDFKYHVIDKINNMSYLSIVILS